MAALAPRLAAELYGLEILAENVEDDGTQHHPLRRADQDARDWAERRRRTAR